jgi:hypothetical protein
MDFSSAPQGKIFQQEGGVAPLIQKHNAPYNIYHITKTASHNFIQLKKGESIILEFKDYLNSPNNLGTFTRFIKDSEYKFIDSKLVVKKGASRRAAALPP